MGLEGSCDHQIKDPKEEETACNTHQNMRSPMMTSRQTDDSTTATTTRMVV